MPCVGSPPVHRDSIEMSVISVLAVANDFSIRAFRAPVLLLNSIADRSRTRRLIK